MSSYKGYPIIEHHSSSGMSAEYTAHLMKKNGHGTLCGRKTDSNSWSSTGMLGRSLTFTPNDCKLCQRKLVEKLAKGTRRVVREMSRLKKSDKVLRKMVAKKSRKVSR